MWHLKTRVGIFWIIPEQEGNPAGNYILGLDQDTLGIYTDPEVAVRVVQGCETGRLEWDEKPSIREIPDLSAWRQGLPEKWGELAGA